MNEEVPFPEQLQTFATSAVIVGRQSPMLANTVFLPPGAMVVELLPFKWEWHLLSMLYYNMTQVWGEDRTQVWDVGMEGRGIRVWVGTVWGAGVEGCGKGVWVGSGCRSSATNMTQFCGRCQEVAYRSGTRTSRQEYFTAAKSAGLAVKMACTSRQLPVGQCPDGTDFTAHKFALLHKANMQGSTCAIQCTKNLDKTLGMCERDAWVWA
eukprot:365646-Chlamydomonas_euryale.AAC.6